jgi:hypothetical protein
MALAMRYRHSRETFLALIVLSSLRTAGHEYPQPVGDVLDGSALFAYDIRTADVPTAQTGPV